MQEGNGLVSSQGEGRGREGLEFAWPPSVGLYVASGATEEVMEYG